MDPMKLDVLFAFFSYGGNGGINMLLPELLSWFHKLAIELREDARINRFAHMRFGDVPLTMERNRAVVTAKQGEFDVLVMLDSDNAPDLYLGKDPSAKSFFWSSFDFLYDRKLQGLPSVIAAPYCGPPPHPTDGGMENVYVFRADDRETGNLASGFSFEAYSRQEAALMTGIHPIAAGPTGCIMYDVDAFDLMPVRAINQEQLLDLYAQGAISKQRALRLLNMQSWFFYEFTDQQQTQKASTEDVTNTREIQLASLNKHGEPAVFCNWDAWAGHYKPKCVGKPAVITVGEVNDLYREAVESAPPEPQEEVKDVDFTGGSREDPGEVETSGDTIDFDADVKAEVSTRMVGGRKVTSVGHLTPDHHLEALTRLVRTIARSRPDAALRVIEVGSWVGESALALHAGFLSAGGTVYCVDSFEGAKTDWTGALAGSLEPAAVTNYFAQNVGELLNNGIQAIRGYSTDVADSMESQDADLVFLDASHDYRSVKADIEAWIRHVSPTGILCGHDYCDQFPGVQRAVKELFDDLGLTPNIIEGTTIWVLRMSDAHEQAQEVTDGRQATMEDAS